MKIVLFFLVFIYSFDIYSQQNLNDSNEEKSSHVINYLDFNSFELGADLGTLLPQGIRGLNDNYPVAGLWFTQPTAYGGVEYSLHSSKAKGVSLYDGSVSLRVDFSVFDIVEGFMKLGFHGVQYETENIVGKDPSWTNTFGSHIGFGSYLQFGGPILGRVDFKFGFGPGNTMILTAGIVYRWGEKETDSN